jgi:hypothetical protein
VKNVISDQIIHQSRQVANVNVEGSTPFTRFEKPFLAGRVFAFGRAGGNGEDDPKQWSNSAMGAARMSVTSG